MFDFLLDLHVCKFVPPPVRRVAMRLLRVYVTHGLVSFVGCLALLIVAVFDLRMKLVEFSVIRCRGLAQWRGILTLV